MSTDPVTPERPGSLQSVLDQAANPIRAMREIAEVPPRPPTRLVPEYTDWRSEQQAWGQSVTLLHLEEHMSNVFVDGPGALAALNRIAINKFGNFPSMSAKQFIAVNEDGFMIGDGILNRLSEENFILVADPAVTKWVEYHLEQAPGDFTVSVDDPYHWYFPLRTDDPKLYRYQVQGPDALKLLEKVIGSPVPETKFFHLTEFDIAGHHVRAVRHGMAGQPGLELFGPYEDHMDVLSAIIDAGKEFGLRQIGSIAYFLTNVESGWFIILVPAIFGEAQRGYREWLPAKFIDSLAVTGSFDSENIEDYYLTPFDAGYGGFIDFEKDFIGKDALVKLRDSGRPLKHKISLIWDDEDLANLQGDLVRPEKGLPPQFRELHDTEYSYLGFDAITDGDTTVGYVTQTAYLPSERRFVSIGVVDEKFAEPGTELTLIWGDSLKIPRRTVEPHRQVPVRVTVAPIPFSSYAREQYRK
ncbi:MAG TPA: aminomethyl transferase family protein [Pseudolysinimonas sp.]|nr:aminomethyl transferase family protein [Pseudolysinimonas sp.]